MKIKRTLLYVAIMLTPLCMGSGWFNVGGGGGVSSSDTTTFLRLDGTNSMSANLGVNNHDINGVANLHANTDNTGTWGGGSLRPNAIVVGTGTSSFGGAVQINGTRLFSSDYLTSIGDFDIVKYGGSSDEFHTRINGSVGSESQVLSGNQLGAFWFGGYPSSGGAAGINYTAGVRAFATQDYTASAQGSKLDFTTAPNGSASRASVLILDQDGGIKPQGGQLAQNATGGFQELKTCATGVPSGTPANQTSGNVSMVYDSTDNKLCVYNGAWKCVTLM